MKTLNFLRWTRVAFAVIALVCGWATGQAFAAVSVPTCNSFDTNGNPIYSTAIPPDTNGTTNCTDYFGALNWATSPLPASPVTGFTLVSGGSGYINPQVVIADPTGTGATATATVSGGDISRINVLTQGTGYILPKVTIFDAGPCGSSGLPDCGNGAMATAVLGGPYTGGMKKFLDPLKDLKTIIAIPDTTTFPGSDYYEIALVQYSQQMHSSLPPTTLRGYVQVQTGSSSASACTAAQQVSPPSYLGPVIVAVMNRPVRVKFTNCLPTGVGGNLFVPVDPTYMGAGMGPGGETYTENRATLHLHGGATPWISDGTPHQWTAPVGESSTTLLKGDSVGYVPDMFFDATGAVVPPIPQCSKTVTTNCYPNAIPAGLSNNPGPGTLTFYWTNQQGGRLMFYHDHAYGVTRLNVYAGEAAGYLIVDPLQEDILAAGTAPGTVGSNPDLAHLIPLVIQDRTFVADASQMGAQDPTWSPNFGTTPGSANLGDLWMPHVYMPNQNPNDPTMASGVGHWDYGPWFFPPQSTLTAATPNTAVTIPCTSASFPGQTLTPTPACPTCGCPIIPNPSGTPESFMDTPVVNGVAYPVLHLAPEAYRFQILNAANDRSFSLSWFVADQSQNNTEVAMLPADPHSSNSPLPLCSTINPVAVPSLAIGLATGLLDASGSPLNGTGLPANCWPNYGPQQGIPVIQSMWPADGRSGGVPDPRTAGPAWVQIGSEGGLMPSPVVIPATPTNYEFNTRSITIGSVGVHGLWIGGAERADVIVDFSKFAGKTLILYNDAPAPAPASDSRLDYFTNDGDQTPIGGAPNTPPGYGPNTRTVMQVVIDQPATSTVPFSLPLLKQAFDSTATSDGLFALTQPTTIVPQAGYSSAYNQAFTDTFFGIQSETLTFTPFGAQNLDRPCAATPPAICGTLDRKTIQELFTADYGRMNATLGVELPLTNFLTQTTIPYGYVDPPTEIMREGDTQLWRITHNGVDTHFIHFHLFNVQVVNRVGWDGSLRPPDANELGWKDTVRMNPLEDILVAIQPITPLLPFPIADSIRYMDVAMGPPTFTNVDPNNNPVTVTNIPINFGWEYVWHCHILGHEENDMMRPIVYQVAPYIPGDLLATGVSGTVTLTWTDNSASEDSYTIQRDTDPSFSTISLATFTVDGTSPNLSSFSTPSFGQTVTFLDSAGTGSFYYRVQANNSFTPTVTVYPLDFQPASMSSAWSNIASNGPVAYASVAPASLDFLYQPVGTASTLKTITLTNTGTSNMTGIVPSLTGGNPGSFTITGNTCPNPLTAGSSCSITVSFAPPATQPAISTVSAVLTITSNAQNAPGVQLLGTGTGSYAAILTSSLTFANQPLNTLSTAQTFTVANTGNAVMSGLTFTTSGGTAPADFLLAHDCGPNLAPGSFCTISVTFNPSAAGPRTTSVIVAGSALNLPLNVSLSGTGILQAAASYTPTSLSFGTVVLNTLSTAQTVTVSNTGSLAMTVGVSITGTNAADFSQTNTCGTGVAINGGTCTISVTFRPSAIGAASATMVIATNDPVNPTLTVPMTGLGTAIGFTPASISFGNQLLGSTSPAHIMTLSNVSGAAVPITGISIMGPGAGSYTNYFSTNCGTSVGAGRSCTISLRMKPLAAGPLNALLSISSTDPASPFVAPLSGTGIARTAVVSPTLVSFGTVTAGEVSSSQTVTVTNTGNAALTFNSMNGFSLAGASATQFGLTTGGDCADGGILGVGASCTVSVAFQPSASAASGVMNAAIFIRDNSTGSSIQVVTLSGTAIGLAPAAAPLASARNATAPAALAPSTAAALAEQAALVVQDPSAQIAATAPVAGPRGASTSILSASAMSFGIRNLFSPSEPITITLTNHDSVSLTITSIAIDGRNAIEFNETNTCGVSLPAGATCNISVTYAPSMTGSATAELLVMLGDPVNRSEKVPVSGSAL